MHSVWRVVINCTEDVSQKPDPESLLGLTEEFKSHMRIIWEKGQL